MRRFLATHFDRIGPKHSRNLLQILGLTRYEIPLDGRVTKWLNDDLGFAFDVSAASLSDPDYYDLISEGVQQLCATAEVLPCVLDAAVYVSFDERDLAPTTDGR